MTTEQIEIINALTQVTMLPGSWDKRFVSKIVHTPTDKTLTESQNEWLYRLLYKYRRQTIPVYKKYAQNEFCRPKGPKLEALKANAQPLITNKPDPQQTLF